MHITLKLCTVNTVFVKNKDSIAVVFVLTLRHIAHARASRAHSETAGIEISTGRSLTTHTVTGENHFYVSVKVLTKSG